MMTSLRLILALARKRPGDGIALPTLERTLRPRPADAARLAVFRELTGFPDNGLLPPTWVHAEAFRAHLANLADPRFPLPLPGIIHLSQSIRQHRPVGAGERLSVQATIANHQPARRGYRFDLVTRVWAGRDSQLAIESVATMLYRAPGPKPPARPGAVDPEAAAADPPAINDPAAASQTQTLKADLAPAFAKVTGDFNPIHLGARTARWFGFRGVVLHGLWSATRLLALCPEALDRPRLEFECVFKAPLILPAGVCLRSWAAGTAGRELRLLDLAGTHPYAIGSLRWAEGGENAAGRPTS